VVSKDLIHLFVFRASNSRARVVEAAAGGGGGVHPPRTDSPTLPGVGKFFLRTVAGVAVINLIEIYYITACCGGYMLSVFLPFPRADRVQLYVYTRVLCTIYTYTAVT